MTELVNVAGGLIVAATSVLVTWLLARHKPKVDRRTADVAEKQLALDSLRAASLEWREYASIQMERAEAAERAAEAAAKAAEECRDLARIANERAARAERRNQILIDHWPEGTPMPKEMP